MADRVGRPEVFGVQPERWFSYPWLQYFIFARQVKLDWQGRTAGDNHSVNEVLYLRDPDGNGVELCWDIVRRNNGRASPTAAWRCSHAHWT